MSWPLLCSTIFSLSLTRTVCSYNQSVPSDRTVPTCSFLLLLKDLEPLLTRQSAPGLGQCLMTWRQFTCVFQSPLHFNQITAVTCSYKRAAELFAVPDTATRKKRHMDLSAFFTGAWAGRLKPLVFLRSCDFKSMFPRMRSALMRLQIQRQARGRGSSPLPQREQRQPPCSRAADVFR